MTDPKRVQELFLQIVNLSEDARAEVLDRECGTDAALRRRIVLLLDAHDDTDGPLNVEPADSVASSTLVPGGDGAGGVHIEPGTVINGQYTLRQKIGEGGMGEVWVARQTQPVKRKVALKVIKIGMDSRSVVNRFEQERQALAMMDHPSIARVLDGGMTETGRPFFVMELVDGLPVNKFCDAASLSLNERLSLFVQVCHAVQHAHQKGLIHRDLKPANILVTMVDGQPVPKVIDFGVAKATGGKLSEQTVSTQFGAIVGTLEYMSPEQAGFSAHDVDTRSDIYSLGVVLYELLTGLRPLDARRLREAGFAEMVRVIQEEEPSRPSTRLSTDESLPSLAAVRQTEPRKLVNVLRGELDWIVMKSLEKDRNRRYDSANALADDVRRYLAHEPVVACPQSPGYRLRRFARKNRAAVVAAFVIAMTLMVATVVSGWSAWRASKAEQKARADARNNAEMVQILTSAFESVDPRMGGDARMEARDVLENALGLLKESDLDDAAKAMLLHGIHNAFNGIGEWETATSVAQECLDLRKRALGDEHVMTIRAMGNLAQSYARTERMDEAIRLMESTVRRATTHLGESSADTLHAMDNLGGMYRVAGRPHDSAELLEKTLELKREHFGPERRNTLSAKANLATTYHVLGRNAEARELLEPVLETYRRKLSSDHPLTLGAMHDLAPILWELNERSRAIRLLEETAELELSKLGVDHPTRIITLRDLALHYYRAGRLPEATALSEQVLELRQKESETHLDTIRAKAALADCHMSAGRVNKAVELFGEVASALEQQFGPDREETLDVLFRRADCYMASQQFELAIQEYKQLFPRWVSVTARPVPDPGVRSRRLRRTAVIINNYVWSCVATDLHLEELSPELLEELRRAAAADRAPFYLSNTLAVAEYRRQNFDEAIVAANRSNALKPHPISHAVLALCAKAQGNDGQAATCLEQFKRGMETDDFGNDPDCQAFEAELREVFELSESSVGAPPR